MNLATALSCAYIPSPFTGTPARMPPLSRTREPSSAAAAGRRAAAGSKLGGVKSKKKHAYDMPPPAGPPSSTAVMNAELSASTPEEMRAVLTAAFEEIEGSSGRPRRLRPIPKAAADRQDDENLPRTRRHFQQSWQRRTRRSRKRTRPSPARTRRSQSYDASLIKPQRRLQPAHPRPPSQRPPPGRSAYQPTTTPPRLSRASRRRPRPRRPSTTAPSFSSTSTSSSRRPTPRRAR